MPGDIKQQSTEPLAVEPERPEWVVLGRIAGLYGVRGWVKVYSHTSPRANILEYPRWYLHLDGQWREYVLRNGRAQGKGIVAQLEGCVDRDQAASLLKAEVAIRRDQLPELAPNEFYWTDLEGLRVRTLSGVELGIVDNLFETGANDVVVVKGDRERLIPYLWQEVIQSVDLDAGLMVIDWDPEF